MATVTGYTASRMQDIEDNSIVGGSVVVDNLILEKHNGDTIDAGNVRGADGPPSTTTVGLVWATDIGSLGLGFRQVTSAQATGTPTNVFASSMTIPTVIGRRYSYVLSGAVLFEIATATAHIRVLHSGTNFVNLYQDYAGLASSYHDVNRKSRSWLATVTNFNAVQLQITRTAGTGAVTLDPTPGPIFLELYDEGALP